jgi:tetratricopeptide (TPR) repeat protein
MKRCRTERVDLRARLQRVASFLLVVACALAYLPGYASAQEGSADLSELLERVDTHSDAYEKAPVAASSVDAVNLDVHWRLWKRVVAGDNLGVEELTALSHDSISIGHRNLPEHATAVYTTTGHKVASGELSVRDGTRLYETAAMLAPDLPYPEFALSAHLVRHNLGRMPAIVGSYKRGIEKGFNWLDTRLSWELKLTAHALIAVLVAALFFLLAQLLRYFGIVAYDSARLLPKGFSSNQTVIVLVALVVVPGILMRSPLLSVLLLLAVLSLVQSINERIVTLVIFGVLAALPFLDQRMSEQVVWPNSQTQRLDHAQNLHCDDACHDELDQRWRDGADGPVSTYILAANAYRRGGGASLERVTKLLDGADQWPAAIQPAAANLLGATLVAQGKPEEAIEHLQRSKSLDPDSAAPLFNLMRAHQMTEDAEAAANALDAAISVDLDRVRAHLELSRRDVNSFLLVEPLSADIMLEHHRSQQLDDVSLVSPVWKALAGPRLPLDWAPLLGAVGALLALLSLPLYLTRRTSSPCPKCGMARDPSDAPKTGDHRYCLPCYHTFVSGASLEYRARVHNERVLGRRERFQDVMRRLLSVVMPGTGHSQAGHGLGGFVLSLLVVFGAMILVRPFGPWRPPFELFTDNWAAQQSLAWVLISIGAFFALAAVGRGISSSEVRSPTNKRKVLDE